MSKVMLSVGVATRQVTHKSVDLEIQAPGLPVKALCPRLCWLRRGEWGCLLRAVVFKSGFSTQGTFVNA